MGSGHEHGDRRRSSNWSRRADGFRELLQLNRQRWLREVQPRGGTRHARLLRDDGENPELVERRPHNG